MHVHEAPIPQPQTHRVRRRATRGSFVAAVASTAMTVGMLAVTAGTASAVVGGEPIDISKTPWQVSLQDADGHFCGGSVLSARLVLTAAHCTLGTNPTEITVRAGVNLQSSTSGQDRKVVSIFENPGYGAGLAADVSVLVLAEPLQFNGNVQPIALANAADLTAASTATTGGWGAVSETADGGTDSLLVTTVPLVDDATCAVTLAGYDTSHDSANEVCAGGTGTDSCYGDSGGPLVVQDALGVPKLVGVVSWGVECGGTAPGVYAEVPAFAQWIAGITPETTPSDPTQPDTSGGVDPSSEPDATSEADPVSEPDATSEADPASDAEDGSCGTSVLGDGSSDDEAYSDEAYDDGAYDDEAYDDGSLDDEAYDEAYDDGSYDGSYDDESLLGYSA